MGPVHFIIGAAGGIGSALAREFARESEVRLVLAGRDAARLDELAREVGGTTKVLDATRGEELDAALRSTVEEFGAIDGLVNCAGSILLKPAHRTSDDEWRATLSANLDTAFATVRAGTQAMMRRGGSIVLMSSAAAGVGLPNHEAIAAAKAGVEGLVRAAAASYAGRGIRVNAVAPGLVRTPLSAAITASEASEKASIAMHPAGRLGEPEDVARTIAFLLDPAHSWMTGEVVRVDGGLASVRGR